MVLYQLDFQLLRVLGLCACYRKRILGRWGDNHLLAHRLARLTAQVEEIGDDLGELFNLACYGKIGFRTVHRIGEHLDAF